MSENNITTAHGNSPAIRIIGLNKDKTRRMERSETMYRIFFELSGNPPIVWKKIFEQEWKAASASFAPPEGPHETAIDRGFLVIHSPLTEVAAKYLPALKKTVATANANYAQYDLLQAQVHVQKENIWKDERKRVDELASTLTFE